MLAGASPAASSHSDSPSTTLTTIVRSSSKRLTRIAAGTDARLRAEARSRAAQFELMFPASSKIGRYIAMIRPPTTTPRNAIMIGSISEVIADTAESTSSS